MAKEDNLKPFKKGQSGNPNGRIKGSIAAKTILNKYLASLQEVENPFTQEIECLTLAEQIHLKHLFKALSGDKDAYNSIMDRTEGKAQTNIKMDADVTQRTVHVGFSDEVEEENEYDND